MPSRATEVPVPPSTLKLTAPVGTPPPELDCTYAVNVTFTPADCGLPSEMSVVCVPLVPLVARPNLATKAVGSPPAAALLTV